MRSLKALTYFFFFFFQKEDVSRKETGTFVIVTPGSVMYNWKEELETWGHFKTGLFHGNARKDTIDK